jgi:hypothetical protein
LKDFLQTWLKCSPQQGYVQNPCHSFAGLRSRSHLKVKNWLRKCSLILTYIWIFLNLGKVFAWNLKYKWSVTIKICWSSFITLYCILTKLCPFLIFKFTYNHILDNMLCPLYKSYTNGRIFFKLFSNVHLNKVMCRIHVTFVQAKGQGQTWRSKIDLENVLRLKHVLEYFGN